ncbi:hypothetical protein FN846DRAFT_178287 [Sphaerosporella brunnea]|uniref:Uncharacterized protein n=1 Tax=Sphaerosporella brunnea TaxID=1250544 RepID=A0A5J5EQI3_9PEZI|nr:hypothetical protein FN846DRAFT_178287 [Sphaerosporella brunnea]
MTSLVRYYFCPLNFFCSFAFLIPDLSLPLTNPKNPTPPYLYPCAALMQCYATHPNKRNENPSLRYNPTVNTASAHHTQ